MFKKIIAPGLSAAFYIVLLALAPFGLAAAEDTGSAAATAEQHYDIKESSLSEALIEFSSQSDIVVVVSPAVTDGKLASSANGNMTADEAMDALLEGTGLEYSRDESGVTIKEPNQVDAQSVEDAEPDGEPMAALMYADSQDDMTVGGGTSSSSPASSSPTVDFRGSVIDARTGSSLKGALVELVELGRSESTDDLGRFRFSTLPAGRHTLRISYLGYLEISETVVLTSGDAYQKKFAMTGGDVQEEIIVYGTRSSRAQSLNQERMAENMSSVVSSDLLGNFEGTTISEALRRVPGVAFEQDEFTGDGINVTIRGLQADFNAVKLNGIELPETTGRGRTANLANILADSVDKITISKSLLANQDSSGTGGLIEIETKSPLDRPERYARFGVERGQTGSGFMDEDYYTGTVAGTFGTDKSLGLGLSVQYRDSRRETVQLGGGYAYGEYLPLGPNNNPSISNPFWLDPRSEFPFDPGANGLYQNRVLVGTTLTAVKNLSATVTVEKQIGEHTNLRLDYTKSQQENSDFQTNVSYSPSSGYSLRPVQALGGEERQALSLSGSHLAFHNNYGRDGTAADTQVISFNGNSNVGKWDLDYKLGYTKGEGGGADLILMGMWNLVSSFSTPLDPLLLPETIDPVEGIALSAFPAPANGSVGLPLLNQAGWEYYNSPENFTFSNVQLSTDQGGESTRNFGELSAKYNIENGWLTYVEVGTSYEKSRFESYGNTDLTGYSAGFFGPSIDGAGITEFENSSYLSRIGLGSGFHLMSWDAVRTFAGEVPQLAEGPDPFFTSVFTANPRTDLPNVFTEEAELAAYLQARMDIGRFEVIGGVRMTQVDVDAVQIFVPAFIDEVGNFDQAFSDEFTEIAKDSATDTRWLPRILANYRHSDNFIVRAGYFKSVARPRIQDLSSGTDISLDLRPIFGPSESQPQLRIRSGNPALEPSFTDNFDLSFERYYDDIGAIKLGLFYKKVDNLFESIAFVTSESDQFVELLQGVKLPDDPRFDLQNLPANLNVSRSVPENSGFDGTIWGIEAAVERQLSFLPGFWGGFGVFANFTYTESEKDFSLPWFSKPIFDDLGNVIDFDSDEVIVRNVAFDRQPKRSGTVALTYNKYWIDASLSYSYQSQRGDRGDGTLLWQTVFTDEVDSLDLRAEYWFERGPIQFRVFLEGSNLLRGSDETSANRLVGPNANQIANSTYFGGRSFRVGISGSY